MIGLAVRLGLVAALWWAASAFGRASVRGVKVFFLWVLALAGLCVGAGLVLTGRGSVAVSALVLLGPLGWSYWAEARGKRGAGGPAGSGRVAPVKMGRAEALAILGLREGASDTDIRAAYVRVMRGAHPDGGGSDWLAVRVNAARDVLLRRG